MNNGAAQLRPRSSARRRRRPRGERPRPQQRHQQNRRRRRQHHHHSPPPPPKRRRSRQKAKALSSFLPFPFPNIVCSVLFLRCHHHHQRWSRGEGAQIAIPFFPGDDPPPPLRAVCGEHLCAFTSSLSYPFRNKKKEARGLLLCGKIFGGGEDDDDPLPSSDHKATEEPPTLRASNNEIDLFLDELLWEFPRFHQIFFSRAA